MTNASSRIACIRLALPLLVALALLAPPAVAQAETVTPTCSAQLLYTGYDKVDITYSFDGSGKNASLTLFDAQNGTRQIVAPAPSGSGKTRIGGLTPGVWSLMAVGPDANTTCLTFDINGNITGTPQEDDVIGEVSVGMVSVSTDQTSGALTLSRTTVTSDMLLHNSADTTKILVQNSLVGGIINVSGNNIDLIGNQLLGGVALLQRTNVHILDNVLELPIDLGSLWDEDFDRPVCGDWCRQGPEPLISGNSFVGRYALTARDAASWWANPPEPGDPAKIWRPIPVGCNFYGSVLGYTVAPDTAGGPYTELPFLAYTGAYVDTLRYYAECKNPKGEFLDNKIFPLIWAESWIAGQNVLLHSNRNFVPYGTALTGRKTLLSVDVRSTREELQGAKFYVMFKGERIDSLPATVRRSPLSYLGSDGFKNTVNFILPPIPPSDEEVVNVSDCSVYVDVSGIPGGDIGRPPGNAQLLTGCGGMQFKQPPPTFKVSVYPVDVYGYCQGSASTAGVLASLSGDLAAMFPIRPQDIQVTSGPRVPVECSPLSSIKAEAFWTHVNAALSIMGGITGRHAGFDRVIAVVPRIAGFDIEGANNPFSQKLLVVREDQPEAVPHEMGHSLDLGDNYTGWPSYKDGELLYGLTAFDPELSGRFGIRPGKHFWSAEQDPYTYDIMGNNNQMWPNAVSYNAFRNYFSPPTNPARARDAAVAPTQTDATTARTIFFSASMICDTTGGWACSYFDMDPRSVSLFDLTGTGITPSATTDDTWNPLRYYFVHAYDAQGKPVYEKWLAPWHSFYDWAYWRPLDIPASAVKVTVKGNEWAEPLVWVKDSAFAAQLLSPRSGAALTDTLTLTWQQSRADLTHIVLYSVDGGATWDALSPPFAGDRLELSTDFLPADTPVVLRALTSDGFQHAETRVDNLVRPNRPPIVSIRFPPDGAQAPPGYAWQLQGMAGDVEDLAAGSPLGAPSPLTGKWASSKDGPLGDGNTLADVVLSPGVHVLTFSAKDSKGATSQAQVTVTVAAVTQVDLAVEEDALSLLAEGYNPRFQGSTLFFTPGVTNTVRARLTGAGVPVTATVAIYANVVGEPPALLTRQVVALEPFAQRVVTAAFNPGDLQPWQLTVAIEAATVPDPTLANNRRTWQFSAQVANRLYLPALQRE